jgi:surface antigen
MRAKSAGTKTWLLSSALLLSSSMLASNADAAQHNRGRATIRPSASFHAHQINTHMTLASGARMSHAMHLGSRRFANRSYGISCVPYARQVSGIMVAGNAWQWWDNAEGRYARGDHPEVGSVLNFRSNGRMRLGHVAVVTQVVNAREVMVDHANWPGGGGRGGVSHDVTVVDVSEANNWSAVRVELGRGGEFGSVYPTYGFIYNRPDTGFVTASVTRPAPQPEINRVPSDLRPAAERPWHTIEEVAEAPANRPQRIDLSVSSAPIGPEQ